MKKNIHPDYTDTAGHLHLRQQVHHAQHRDQRHHPRRRLLAVPPLLHRQAEDPRHRRSRGPLREALRREEGQPKPKLASTPAPVTARAGAGAVVCARARSVRRGRGRAMFEAVEGPGGRAPGAGVAAGRARGSTADQGLAQATQPALRRAVRDRAQLRRVAASSARTSGPPGSSASEDESFAGGGGGAGRSGAPSPRSGCGTCWCRVTRPTPRTRSSRSSPARAVRSRRCSPATCCGCTPATPSGAAGRPSSSTRPSPTSVATSR